MKETKNKIVNYVKETRAEVKKVAWPDRKYVTAATAIVLLIVVLLAALVMVIDWGLAKIFLFLTKAV